MILSTVFEGACWRWRLLALSIVRVERIVLREKGFLVLGCRASFSGR